MSHPFDRDLARLALEICRYTYAAGVDAPEKANALAFIKQHSRPIGDPIPLRGPGKDATSFACLVPYENRNVISYMGTETEFDLSDLGQLRVSLRDWGKNGKARPVPFALEGKHIGQQVGVTLEGRVHRGFLSELKAVQDQVVTALNGHGAAARPVLVTGHSQGGAEAALATRALTAAGFTVEVGYTLAAPRAGTADFAKSVKTPVHRIEFGDDIGPHLPPTAIRVAIENAIAGGSYFRRRGLNWLLRSLEDVGYVGLGPLCYGHPNEKKFHIDLSAKAERAIFDDRLKSLTKNLQHWGDHHHLAGTTAEVKAGQIGNYTVLVSSDGWPVA